MKGNISEKLGKVLNDARAADQLRKHLMQGNNGGSINVGSKIYRVQMDGVPVTVEGSTRQK